MDGQLVLSHAVGFVILWDLVGLHPENDFANMTNSSRKVSLENVILGRHGNVNKLLNATISAEI